MSDRPGAKARARDRRAGMTLVEVLVVLAIVGVSAGVVVLAAGTGDRQLSVESEANRLADRLRLAADEVLVTRRPLVLTWDAGGYRFTPGRASDVPGEALRDRHDLPAGIRLTAAGTASPTAVDPDGAEPVAVFILAGDGQVRRVSFDGLNATVEAGTVESAS